MGIAPSSQEFSSLGTVRKTSATERRVENMQKLVAELVNHDMLADEIAWFLKFSPSGARKYIRDLREAGVVELAHYVESTATYIGKAVYRIASDPERIQAFLAAITQPKREGKHRKVDSGLSQGGHCRYTMAGEVHRMASLRKKPIVRDPLVAALFGPAASA